MKDIMERQSKGITPVIAIVLLLLVTVGAVGVVYSQFQGLIQDPDTGFLDEVEINIQTVTRSPNETMELRIQNQGEEEYNLSDLARMEYSIPGEQRLDQDTAVAAFDVLNEITEPQCFTSNSPAEIDNFGPSDTATCDTGVEMVHSNDEVTLHIVEDSSGEEITSYTCDPSTSTSATC